MHLSHFGMYWVSEFMAIAKSMTLSTDPCGTLFSCRNGIDNSVPNCTLKVLSAIKFSRNIGKWPHRFQVWSIRRISYRSKYHMPFLDQKRLQHIVVSEERHCEWW